MEETASSTTVRMRLANRRPSERIAMIDLITDMMGLKIRIPKRIWNEYDSDTLNENISFPNRTGLRTGLKVKIPAHIWNAYHPPTPLHKKKNKNAPRKLTLKLRCLSLPPPNNNRGVVRSRTTDCKVKLFRFHYGGPKRQRKGGWQNTIMYEQPCLKATCKSCWRWHGHILREEKLVEG